MKKTEQILEPIENTDWEDNLYYLHSDVEQAMQETAVQFLDWGEKKGYIKHDNGMYCSPPHSTDVMINAIYGNQEFFTTAELFEIFNNEK